MTRVLFIILLLSLPIISFGQFTYIPKNGEKIMFYPASDATRQRYQGYDCVFNTNSAHKNNTVKAKKSYRYKKGTNGLTPFEEIDNHSFTVLAKSIENKEMAEEKQNLLLFLEREDGDKLFFRIPLLPDKKQKSISSKMYVKSEKYVDYDIADIYSINIPCCSVQEIDYIKKSCNIDSLIYYSSNVELSKTFIFKQQAKLFNRLPSALGNNNYIIRCKGIDFVNVNNHPFKQPVAIFEHESERFLLPITNIRGGMSSTQMIDAGIRNAKESVLFSLSDFIITRQSLISTLSREYEFVKAGVYFMGFDYKTSLRYDKGVNFMFDTLYKFHHFDICKKHDLCGIFIDPSGVLVDIPIYDIQNDIDSERKRSFLSYEAYWTKKEAKQKEIKKKAEQRDQKYNNLRERYGKSEADYMIELSDYSLEKYLEAKSKWGRNDARLIVDRRVRIGWSQDKCRMSWGEPEDINTSIGSWGRHEQWCYSSSYLYFENGKLTSIQY